VGSSHDADDFFHGIKRMQPYPNAIAAIGRQMQSHEVGLDGQFTMSAIHQHGQSNSSRSAQVANRVERRADGSSRKQHIVDQDNLGTVHGKSDLRAAEHGPAAAAAQVVTIECDVHRAHDDLVIGQESQFLGQTLSQWNTAAPHSDQVERQIATASVPDRSPHSRNQPFDFLGVA